MRFSERLQMINGRVNGILADAKVRTLPVKIEEIARSFGLKVIPYPFDDNISGTLVIEQNVIGFNQFESRVRRRFTVAHELGHFILHKDKRPIFLDKLFRLNSSSTSTDQNYELELEANLFAAAILMPETILRKEVKNIELDFGNEEGIKYLARIFDVSSTAMYYRLKNLDLF